MKASLSTHILIKVGAPVVLFFVFILISDFYYLAATLEKRSIGHLHANSESALQLITPYVQREKEFISQLVSDAEADRAPDEAALSAGLNKLYGHFESSIRTIKQLSILYQPSDRQPPSFYCMDYLFFIAQARRQISVQAVSDRDPNCHSGMRVRAAELTADGEGKPFWLRLQTVRGTRILWVHPLGENAKFAGFVAAEISAEEIYEVLRLVGIKHHVHMRTIMSSENRFWNLPEWYETHHLDRMRKTGSRAMQALDYKDAITPGMVQKTRDPVLRETAYLIRQPLPMPGLYIEQYKPAGELFQLIYDVKTVSIAFGLSGLLIVLLIIFFSGRSLSRPIEKLAEQARTVAKKESFFQMPKKQLPKEITQLGLALENMLAALKKRTKELVRSSTDRERIQSELKIASKIQTGLLPKQFGRLGREKDFEIYAHNRPALETGGDVYDFFPLHSARTGVLVADVSGKGISSALLMTMAKIIIKTAAKEKNTTAGRCLEKVNNVLMQENTSTMFVTAFYGILDTEKKCLDYAVAGHNPPIISHADGSAQWLKFDAGSALSVMRNESYPNNHLDFAKGDNLLIYTDGLTEAENKENHAYGETRLQKLMSRNCGNSAQRNLELIVNEIKIFTRGQPAFDDVTLLCLRYDGGHRRPWSKRWSLKSNQEEISSLLSEFHGVCRQQNIAEETSHDLCLALDELVSNSLRHGRQKGERERIIVIIEEQGSRIKLTYEEPGAPFDMRKTKQPQTDLSWRERKPGGLGLYLIKRLFDEVAYQYQEGCNVLTLTKTIRKDS